MTIELTDQDFDCQRALRDILEANPDCAKIVDLQGRIASINENGRIFVGAPSVGRPWTTFMPEASRPAADAAFARASVGETVRLAAPCVTEQGDHHCDWTLSPLRRAGGDISAVLVVTRDISDLVTSRIQAEQRERDQRRQSAALKAAGQVAKFGAWEFDYHADQVILSDELWTLLRGEPRLLTIEEGVGLFSPEDRDWIQADLLAARRGGAPFRFDVEVRRADGSAMWMRFFGAAEAGAGLAAGLAAVLRGGALDITEQRGVEQALIDARDAAQAATDAKSAFLANMSHEIRTPLHGVLGMTQVMQRGALSPQQQTEALALIRRSGQTLMSLLNDILDISRIEAGRLTLDERAFELEDLLETACAPFGYLAELKDLELGWSVTPSARGAWRGDDVRLRQVVTNLVSNAVKFTAAGVVTVSADACETEVSITVSDTGIGIAPEILPGLFETFAQADSSTTRKFGGSGLGLAISRDLARLMGGTIAVESTLGQGAAFRLTVPLARMSAAQGAVATVAEERKPGLSGRPLRILAAEDNPMNQQILRAMLDPLDVDLHLTADGDEALAAAQSQTFDLILMDIQMPRRNGVDAARAIRAGERAIGQTPTPIIALTANVMAHQREEYLQAGMDDIIEKPIEISALYAAIDSALKTPSPA